MNKEKISSIFSKIVSDKKIRISVVISLCVILLFSLFLSNTNSKPEAIQANNSVEQYVSNLENKLSKTLSQVKDVGSVSVVITVSSGMETVLAMKTITNQTANGVETEETPLVVNGKTVVLREDYPKITGVLIVAQGGNNFAVLSKIQQATMSLLDIELNQIEILTKK